MSKSVYGFRYVCVSVRMEHLAWHLADFHEILYLSVFRNSAEKIQVLFKSDKNNDCSTWRIVYNYNNISINYS